MVHHVKTLAFTIDLKTHALQAVLSDPIINTYCPLSLRPNSALIA